MSRALEGLGSLPWGMHAVVALAMAAGLVLWLMGQRYMKHIVVLLGATTGALIGTTLAPAILAHGSTGGSAPVYQGLLAGLFVGALAGLLLFRSAMALALGVVLGALLPLTAATVLHFRPLSQEAGERVALGQRDAAERVATVSENVAQRIEHEQRAAIGRAVAGRGMGLTGWTALAQMGSSPSGDGESVSVGDRLPESMRAPAERVRAFTDQLIVASKDEWNSIPEAHRAIILVSGVIGLAAGVILGLMMPAWGAASCTAMFGASVWIAAFIWLSNALGAPWRTQLDRGPSFWLAVWAGASVIGMIVQWSGVLTPRKKKPAAPAPKPTPAAAG